MKTKRITACMMVLCFLLFTACSSGSDTGTSRGDGSGADGILAKVDKDYGIEFTKEISLIGNDDGKLGFKAAGSTGERKVAERIQSEMESLGLQNVTMDEFPVDSWEIRSASLEILSPDAEKNEMILSSYAGSIGTPAEGITAEIVDVGAGTAQDYEGKDVTGKIVLASFDLDDDYWLSAPVYQAELMGAKAFIIAYNGQNYGTMPDALNSFDSQVRTTIPVLNMSRNDASQIRSLMTQGPVSVKVNADIEMKFGNGVSQNVVGMIPGENPDQYIILSAHYDSYFYSFIDDHFGIGTMMTIAKAIMESEYQPKHTIVFVAHGAEEYGVSQNHYDWCIGSWYATHVIHPEWSGNTMAILNTDAVRVDTPAFRINSTPELHTFFEEYILGMSPPKDLWKDGVELKGLNGPWSDDYNYAITGTPGVISGRGPSEWKEKYYHTDLDHHENENMDAAPGVLEYCAQNYVSLLYTFDQMAVTPLDFKPVMLQLQENLEPSIFTAANVNADPLIEAAKKLEADSSANYQLITEANRVYAAIKDAQAAGEIGEDAAEDVLQLANSLKDQNTNLLQAYKMMQGDLMKLDHYDVVYFSHQIIQGNYSSLQAAIDALGTANATAALEALVNVDYTIMAALFDKTVYQFWGIDAIDTANRTDAFWGTGKTLPQLNTYDVYHSILDKGNRGSSDYTSEIAQLNKMLQFEADLLSQSVDEQTKIITNATNLLNMQQLRSDIETGKQILESAGVALPDSE